MTTAIHHKPLLAIVCGPTAVGKTALAVELADYFDIEVVSADSRQVYIGMDIGTAKPSRRELALVKHHLIDVVRPDQAFDASRFAWLAHKAIEEILDRGHRPLLVGGTGLYIRALTAGLLKAPGAAPYIRRRLHDQAEREGRDALYQRLQEVDPAAAQRLHPNDLVRIVRALEVFEQTGRPLTEFQKEHGFADQPYCLLKIGLTCERDLLYERIDQRATAMFEQGLLEETAQLIADGYAPELKSMQTIGYRHAVAVLQGKMSREDAILDLQRATRRYAKQQLTWFRQDKSIIWVDSSSDFVTIRKLFDDFYAC